METRWFWSRPFCGARGDGIWWFRLFGWGIWAADVRSHPPLFSERYGYKRVLFVSKHWRIALVRP